MHGKVNTRNVSSLSHRSVIRMAIKDVMVTVSIIMLLAASLSEWECTEYVNMFTLNLPSLIIVKIRTGHQLWEYYPIPAFQLIAVVLYHPCVCLLPDKIICVHFYDYSYHSMFDREVFYGAMSDSLVALCQWTNIQKTDYNLMSIFMAVQIIKNTCEQ